jgi:hypothetical protein
MEESVEHLKQFSKGICMTQVMPQIIGAIVFFCISLTFFTLNVNDREHIDVPISVSVSSHRPVKLSTKVHTTQKEIPGKNITNTSHNTVRHKTERYYNRHQKKYMTRTVSSNYCIGNVYEYKDENDDIKTKQFHGYEGLCNTNDTRLIIDSSNQHVILKPTNFKYNCNMKTSSTENETLDQNVVCQYRSCPKDGEYSYALHIKNNKLECPEVLNGNYNTCSMKLSHKGREYPWSEKIKGTCEGLVGSKKKLFYSEETDDFKREWNAPYMYIRRMGVFSLIVSIILGLYVWLTVKVELFCHVKNALNGANLLKNKIKK